MFSRIIIIPFTVCLLLSVACTTVFARFPTGQVADQLRSVLLLSQDAPRLALGSEDLQMQQSLPRFYQMREYGPAWLGPQGINPQAEVLLDALHSAALEGLCPEDYHLDYIETLVRLSEDSVRYGLSVEARWLVQLDMLLSDAFLIYASHMIQGRVDPEVVHDGWKARIWFRPIPNIGNCARPWPITGGFLPWEAGPGYLREKCCARGRQMSGCH